MKNKNWVDWKNDKKRIEDAISKSKSRIEVLKTLGYNHKCSKSRKKLNEAIKCFNIDISHFTNRTDRWDVLPEKIKDCYCISDVLKAVGLKDKGNNFKTAKRVIKELNLDINHFIKRTGKKINFRYKEVDVFCKNSHVLQSTLRDWLHKTNKIPYYCANCLNNGIWNEQKLKLEIDHKNGINNDNRIENLRWLCPNCHSQTETFGSKNIKLRMGQSG